MHVQISKVNLKRKIHKSLSFKLTESKNVEWQKVELFEKQFLRRFPQNLKQYLGGNA